MREPFNSELVKKRFPLVGLGTLAGDERYNELLLMADYIHMSAYDMLAKHVQDPHGITFADKYKTDEVLIFALNKYASEKTSAFVDLANTYANYLLGNGIYMSRVSGNDDVAAAEVKFKKLVGEYEGAEMTKRLYAGIETELASTLDITGNKLTA
ncbi:MAG: hypothetical protein LW823_05695 [Rickettsiales bacterium]|jgi:hypothetical protein|nr:hypothetical protein [Rickettsiales bacterium]